jgi:hypothetical protein
LRKRLKRLSCDSPGLSSTIVILHSPPLYDRNFDTSGQPVAANRIGKTWSAATSTSISAPTRSTMNPGFRSGKSDVGI